jgi:hypothetical protein
MSLNRIILPSLDVLQPSSTVIVNAKAFFSGMYRHFDSNSDSVAFTGIWQVSPTFSSLFEDTDANWYSIFPQFQYQTIYIMMIDKIVWLHSNPRMIRF